MDILPPQKIQQALFYGEIHQNSLKLFKLSIP